MKSLLRNNIVFFVPFLLFLFISTVFIFSFSKPEIHIVVNKMHLPFLDSFFKLITYFGDGTIYLFVLVYFLTRKYKWAIVFIAAVILSNIILYFCKHILFEDMYRPSKYFELFETYKLYLVEGVQLHNINSFPSGHTTTAFTVFFTMTIVLKKHWAKLLMFFFALLTAYSRMYLSQHFLADVVVGSILGTGSVMLAFYYSKYLTKPWMQKALFSNGKRRKGKNIPPVTETPGIAAQ